MASEPTILFVEDDTNLVHALSMEFAGRYDTLKARDPDSGIDLVRSRRGEIDVAVVDLWMPRKGRREVDQQAGFTFLKAVKGFEDTPGIDEDLEIIVLSGHLAPETIAQAKAIGACACVMKGTPRWLDDLDARILEAAKRSLANRKSRLDARIDTLGRN